MKYLFLDIDGVLNTGRHSNYLVDNGLSETDADGYLFDPKAVENLEYIIEETDAKIIITSTWRLDGDMQALWRNRDLAGEVIGVTPKFDRRVFRSTKFISIEFAIRGMEVEEWINNNATIPYKYAILDDEDDYLPSQSDYLVLTDPMTGITKEVADKVINLLD